MGAHGNARVIWTIRYLRSLLGEIVGAPGCASNISAIQTIRLLGILGPCCWSLGVPLIVQITYGSFRLLGVSVPGWGNLESSRLQVLYTLLSVSGPGLRSLIWPGQIDNSDHQAILSPPVLDGMTDFAPFSL